MYLSRAPADGTCGPSPPETQPGRTDSAGARQFALQLEKLQAEAALTVIKHMLICCFIMIREQAGDQAADQPPEDARSKLRLSVAADAGAIVSALVASACCVGPLILALLGLGGGALLVKFEPYRSVFIAITVALLGAGFWLQYRRRKPARADGAACDCPAPRASRTGRVLLWVATVAVAGLLAFPYAVPLLFG